MLPRKSLIVSLATLALTVALLGTAGCRIHERKNGENKDVDISTPFGGVNVKTDDKASASDMDFTAYPGATVDTRKDKNKDNNANVDMHFGNFRLRVKVVKYLSSDAPDKVIAFYKGDMQKHFGDVLECRDGKPTGSVDQTSQGLKCGESTKGNARVMYVEPSKYKTELRSGSKQHQHIVALQQNGDGSKFALMEVELPNGVNGSDSEPD